MKIVTAEQMRQIEQECARAGLPSDVLMENAGRAVAEAVRRILGDISTGTIVALVGPGNNGGDGLVAARYLHDWGAHVAVYVVGQRGADDRNLVLASERRVPILDLVRDDDLGGFLERLSRARAIVDAIFGTGRLRAITGIQSDALVKVRHEKSRRQELRIIAVDLPSGLNADTGEVDPATPYADETITLGFPKPGLFSFPGAERAGRIEVADIGIPAHIAGESSLPELATDSWVRSLLPARPIVANKGTFGKVMVVAGSVNYVGAAYLACSGAMRVGAGLVTLATAASLHPVLAVKLTEATHLPLPEADPGQLGANSVGIIRQSLDQYQAILVGCGLGQSESAAQFVRALLPILKKSAAPLVIDADGLNILAKSRSWWRRLADDAILTPHPGEMARLTGMSVEAIQSDRLSVAGKVAQEWRKTVVLKGAYTVVAAPDGRAVVSPFANPGLASAGTGDVLAGAIAGLLAQGLAPFEAAAVGVHVHGKAGEIARAEMGDAGIIAGDLLPILPLAMKRIKEKNK